MCSPPCCFGAVQAGLWHWNLAGLALSSLYLAWSTGAKLEADHRVREILAQEGVRYEHLQTQPTPSKTVLRRILGVNGEHAPSF